MPALDLQSAPLVSRRRQHRVCFRVRRPAVCTQSPPTSDPLSVHASLISCVLITGAVLGRCNRIRRITDHIRQGGAASGPERPHGLSPRDARGGDRRPAAAPRARARSPHCETIARPSPRPRRITLSSGLALPVALAVCNAGITVAHICRQCGFCEPGIYASHLRPWCGIACVASPACAAATSHSSDAGQDSRDAGAFHGHRHRPITQPTACPVTAPSVIGTSGCTCLHGWGL